MKTTIDFLDELKARNNGASDYQIAKMLGITRSAVSNYRNKKSHFDDLTAVRVANMLEIDPASVIFCQHAERAKKPEERAIWEGIIERLGGVAAALTLAVIASSAPSPAEAGQASTLHNFGQTVDYAKSRKGRNRKAKATKLPTISELLFPGLFSHA